MKKPFTRHGQFKSINNYECATCKRKFNKFDLIDVENPEKKVEWYCKSCWRESLSLVEKNYLGTTNNNGKVQS